MISSHSPKEKPVGKMKKLIPKRWNGDYRTALLLSQPKCLTSKQEVNVRITRSIIP